MAVPAFSALQGQPSSAHYIPALPAFPPRSPKAPVTSGLRVFFQEHALKLIFALATVLTLIALRGLIAWESVGVIAIRMVPLLTLGMTAMFGLFGQKTHRENPWAAFVYNGLASVLLGFDSLAIAKYWLGNSVPLRPGLFFAAGIATFATGYFLRRLREIPYLHLLHAGALSTLYLLLQIVRPANPGNDLRPAPLGLFGGVYLCYAACCFLAARLARKAAGQKIPGLETDVSLPDAPDTQPSPLQTRLSGWSLAWAFWAHLAVLLVVVLAALDSLLHVSPGVTAWASLALVAGLLYGLGAQTLEAPRLVTVSTGLLTAGGVLRLEAHGASFWNGAGFLLLILSALALVLAAFNARKVPPVPGATALSAAWRRVAEIGVTTVTLLLWSQVLLAFMPGGSQNVPPDGFHHLLLALGCGVLSFLLVRMFRSRISIDVVLSCAAYAGALFIGRFCPGPISLADMLAPFTLLSVLTSCLFTRPGPLAAPLRQTGASPPLQQETPSSDRWILWGTPLTYSALLAIGLALSASAWSVVFGPAVPHLAVSLLPYLAAALCLTAARRSAEQESVRTLAYRALLATSILEVAAISVLSGGFASWNATTLHVFGLGLIVLAWAWWLTGQALARFVPQDGLSEKVGTGGLVTAFLSALFAMLASPLSASAFALAAGKGATEATVWIREATLLGAFVLFALDLYRTRRRRGLLPSLLVFGLAWLANAGRPLPVTPSLGPWVMALWTVFSLGAAGVYLGVARRLADANVARLSLFPALGGYILFAFWQTLSPALPASSTLVEGLWAVGSGGLAWFYLKTALWSRRCAFTYLGVLALTAGYLRGLNLVCHPTPEGYPLFLLPFLTTLFFVGQRVADSQQALLGEPLRKTALALSYLALLWSVSAGYGWTGPAASSNALITWTLLVYGLVYALRLRPGPTQESVATCAVTLTAAYLHFLFTHTQLLGTRVSLAAHSPLSGPRFAQLAVDAGIFWLTVGWQLRRTAKRPDLAQSLLALAGGLALFSTIVGLLTVQTPHEGKWTILALGWSGAIWFALWGLEQGENCLHLGTGSLLFAWGLILYDRYGLDLRMLDLYLLPVGLYLVTLGHQACRRQKLDRAHGFWWAGLLLTLTPTFLAYWQHASEGHTVLLVVECLLSVLWGISQRIRSFVSAGMLFTIAFAASCSVGRVPDIWGTFSALAAGVGLFIAGFYILTHPRVVQRWVSALEKRWQAWMAWR